MGVCQKCGNADDRSHTLAGTCLLPAKPGYPPSTSKTEPKHIDRACRDRVKTTLVNAIRSLSILSCDDLGELALALELIGTELRSEWAPEDRALLMFAKVILDHANTTRL